MPVSSAPRAKMQVEPAFCGLPGVSAVLSRIYRQQTDLEQFRPVFTRDEQALAGRIPGDPVQHIVDVLPFAEPVEGQPGAMNVFTSREAAETFASSDPFVTEGVVARWTVRSWLTSPE
jgi:hypothetical protein